MIELGFSLSSEELTPGEIIKNAIRAEEVGFSFLSISDHFHPWIDEQGQSSFVWTMLGALAQVTNTVRVLTGVTCPTIRIHPVIIAQATATTAALFGNRFGFGVGTGENLNEHVIGLGWPSYETRKDMLIEAIEIIRLMWQGEMTTYHGQYYIVDTARIYTLPEHPPEIIVSGFGPKSAAMAGEIGDGFWATSPEKELVDVFENSGGRGKPKYGMTKVVVHQDVEEAKKIAYKYWPFSAISGQASQELRVPRHFAELGQSVTPEMLASSTVLGTDTGKHIDQIQQFIDAGYTHLVMGQMGPEQEAFLRMYETEVIPHFKKEAKQKKASPQSEQKRGRGRPKKTR